MGTFLSSAAFAQNNGHNLALHKKIKDGIKITTSDSLISVKVGARVQTLFSSSRSLEKGNEWNSNTKIRRARLKLDGWFFTPKLSYKLEGAFSGSDVKHKKYEETDGFPTVLLDAVFIWKAHKMFELSFGQRKLPGNKERLISSRNLQLVDRSLVNSLFTLDRDLSLQIKSKFALGNTTIRTFASIAKGEGRNVGVNNIGGYNYTGKLEILPLGDFKDKGDYFGADLVREPSPKVAFGLTYNLNKGASRQKQSGKFLKFEDGSYLLNDMKTIFVDGVLKYRGFSLSGEYAHKSFANLPTSIEGFPPPSSVNESGQSYYTGTGINMQAGYLFPKNWEVATRYTSVIPDHKYSFVGVKEYTLGVSRYIVGHKIKVQSDVSLSDFGPNEAKNLRYRLQFEIGI